MTKEEVQQKTQGKINAIQALLNQLEIEVTAEQVITDQGIIKLVVFYTDKQKYDIDQEAISNEEEKPVTTDTMEELPKKEEKEVKPEEVKPEEVKPEEVKQDEK